MGKNSGPTSVDNNKDRSNQQKEKEGIKKHSLLVDNNEESKTLKLTSGDLRREQSLGRSSSIGDTILVPTQESTEKDFRRKDTKSHDEHHRSQMTERSRMRGHEDRKVHDEKRREKKRREKEEKGSRKEEDKIKSRERREKELRREERAKEHQRREEGLKEEQQRKKRIKERYSSRNEPKKSTPAPHVKLQKMAGRLLVGDDRKVALDIRDRVLSRRLESKEFHDSMVLETPLTIPEGNTVSFPNEDSKDRKSPVPNCNSVGIMSEIIEDRKGHEKQNRKRENMLIQNPK